MKLSPRILPAFLPGVLLLSGLGTLLGGCGSGDASGPTADQENAFKNPDRSKLSAPPTNGPVTTPATSSLDTGRGGPPSGSTPGAPPSGG